MSKVPVPLTALARLIPSPVSVKLFALALKVSEKVKMPVRASSVRLLTVTLTDLPKVNPVPERLPITVMVPPVL